MKCPSCGYRRQLRDNAYVPRNECPSCGMTYAQSMHQSAKKDDRTDASLQGPGYQSPIDEGSLQQARDRVDSKLRKQMESQQKDKRHQQTLARAKEIATAAVRKRKEEWEQKQHPVDKPMDKHTNDPNDKANKPPGISDEPILLDDPVVSKESTDDAAVMKQADTKTAQVNGNHVTWPSNQTKEVLTSKDAHAGAKAEKTPEQTDDKKKSKKTLPKEAPADSPANVHEYDDPVTVVESEPVPEPELNLEPEQEPVPELELELELEPELPQAAKESRANRPQRTWLAVAWLILIAGGIGAVLSWSTIGHSFGSSESGAFPIGLLLGFAYLATGVLGFAFFWVSSMINRQLKDMHQMLLDLKKE